MSTLRGPACPDMLLNAMSVLTSVKFCFWMFDGQWEHVSNLTDRHVNVLGFLAGTGGRADREHKPRRPSQEAVSGEFHFETYKYTYSCVFRFHFNSMSQED